MRGTDLPTPDDPPLDAYPEDADQLDPHAGCYQPHHGADGYVDCDGRPL